MTKGRHPKVSPFTDQNKGLSIERRVGNLEYDISTQGSILKRLVEQNEQFMDFLTEKKEEAEENHKFWLDARGRLMTAGIISAVGIVGTAVWFAIKHWVRGGQ